MTDRHQYPQHVVRDVLDFANANPRHVDRAIHGPIPITPSDVATMRPPDVLWCYLAWQGIHGYERAISAILDAPALPVEEGMPTKRLDDGQRLPPRGS